MTRGRPTARAIYVFSGALLALGVIFSACAETRFGLGEDCLKDEDCLSGVCSGGHCAAAPPIGIPPTPDAAPDTSMPDSGGDATTTESGSDSPAPADAADGPPAVDANRPDAHEAGGTDAPIDALLDTAIDDGSTDVAMGDGAADAALTDADDGAVAVMDAADDSG
jgi:hypothetical protein